MRPRQEPWEVGLALARQLEERACIEQEIAHAECDEVCEEKPRGGVDEASPSHAALRSASVWRSMSAAKRSVWREASSASCAASMPGSCKRACAARWRTHQLLSVS